VVSIQEITGMEGDIITLQEIFKFVQTGVDEDGKILGRFAPTGIRPHFFETFKAHGIELPDDYLSGAG
jgi:pilus assembly protein CpaF